LLASDLFCVNFLKGSDLGLKFFGFFSQYTVIGKLSLSPSVVGTNRKENEIETVPIHCKKSNASSVQHTIFAAQRGEKPSLGLEVFLQSPQRFGTIACG